MKELKNPTSIKIIYWITKITFWIFAVMSVLLFSLASALLFEIFDETQLHIGIPVAINIIEQGEAVVNNQVLNVEFKEMYGKLHFIDCPPFIGKTYSYFIFIITSISLYIFITFKKFITNVYKGDYFERKNILLLKRIAYALTSIWISTVFYAYFQYFYLVQHLEFTSISITDDLETYPIILLVALFTWVLSHIFIKGVELKHENELTI
jgi:hypothetical protein